jgi:signal transduction histidine kinase/CHASE3 domain sensor protein
VIGTPDASIGRKLTIAFTTVVLLVAILGAAVIWNAARVGRLQHEQTTEIGPRAEAADALAFSILRMSATVRTYALTGAADDAARAREAAAAIETDMAALAKLPKTPEGRVLFEDLEARLRRFLGDIQTFVDRIAREGWSSELISSEREATRQRSDLIELAQRYAALQRRLMHETRRDISGAANGLVKTAGVVTVLVLLGSLATAMALAHGIRRPAQRLRAAAAAIIDGDFTPAMALDETRAAGQFADVRRFRDEIRDAANVFGRMAKIVKEREERLQAQAEELQAQAEELQAQTEELQAQGEELQAQSEELQAQNEELHAQADELHGQADLLRIRQAELERVNEQLRTTEREKDHFLAVLGHELRNPLAAIRSAAALATRDDGRDRPGEAHAVITRQAAHLARLVDDLLDVGRMTSGKLSLSRRPLDLADLVGRCVAGLGAAGRLQDRVVDVRVTPVWVDGDETRLEQVIVNLLSNAEKFTSPGGRVEICGGADHDQAVLRVRDDGVGMDPPLVARMFDMFVQGPQTAAGSGGLGIGLTLCRRIVELHGGTIDGASDGPGRGTTFTIRLPAVAPVAPERSATPEPARRRQRIVVIEDNEDGREMMRIWLEASGHEVHVAADGVAGVALVADLEPDVALIDLGLPGYDGLEVARRIRAADSRKAVLIALTGYGRADDERRAREAGFDMHLVKPVDPDRLITILAGLASNGHPA